MIKNKTLHKLISKILFAGLLINTLPATVALKAQLPKLSQEEVKDEIRKIKKEVRKLTIATVVIPGVIVAVGSIVFLLAYGLAWRSHGKALKLPKKIAELKKISQLKQTTQFFAPVIKRAHEIIKLPSGKTVISKMPDKEAITKALALAKTPAYLKTPALLEKAQKALPRALKRRKWSIIIALSAATIPPVAALLAFIGIGGDTLIEAYDSAERLERMEKEHPGTLTDKQKIIVARLKKMWLAPVPRGIIKYFSLKSALKKSANKALQTQGKLVKRIGLKKARKNASRYIKAKLEAEGLQISVNEMKKQFTAQELKKNKIYKKADKRLKKTQAKIASLEAKFSSLKNIKQKIIDEYGGKVTNILESFEKPALQLEKEAPEIIVPL